MEKSIQELTEAIRQINTGFDWASLISAICSVISLVAIVILLKERSEKKRPYLQISFELVKSSLICLVIRNVGETPAKLKKITFNPDFINQLPVRAKKHAKDRDINISLYPKQQWVLCLDVITPEVLKYQNTQLEITLSYTAKEKKKHYVETELIDFNDYSGFLVYISETDELKEEIKKLGKSLNGIQKTLQKQFNIFQNSMQTQVYANLSDTIYKTAITGTRESIIIGEEGDGFHD